MKRVLFISYTNFFGGAEYVLCDYIKRINTKSMYIYTSDNKIVLDKYKEVFKLENIFYSSNMNSKSIRREPVRVFFGILYNLYMINKIVKRYGIDILYGNNTLDILLITLYKKYINSKIKIISHIHDILEKRMYIKYIKRYSRVVDKFIVPSLATKRCLKECNISDSKIEVVYNGIYNDINLKKEDGFFRSKYNINRNKKIICIIGQICKRKRQDLFIDIVNGLNKFNNEYIGVIIGKIVDEVYFNNIKSSFNSNIIFLGALKREELFNVYKEIDLLLLTSDRDPLPTVILEAMSSGAIVIARNVDGVSEIIEDKKNGYVFKYDETIPHIINLIENVMDKPECIKKMIKKNAEARIKTFFKLENKINQINKLLKED